MAADHISIDDFQRAARRRVPRLFFDYCDGGSGRETALLNNIRRFDEIRMMPRGPRNVAVRSTAVELFGRQYAMPLGVAPIGLANLFWPGTDLALAKAAKAADIPYVLSTAASTMIEDIGPVVGENGWFQLYASKDDSISDDLIGRAERAGSTVLVVTIDVSLPGKRRRDLRNGFRLPMPMGPGFAAQLMRCPGWALSALGQPMPRIVNLERYAASKGAQSLAAFMAAQISPAIDLGHIERFRRRWRGPLVVKGILSPHDAVALADIGVDGVIVSNHGGRQLEAAPATIDALPDVVDAVGHRLAVMVDGGVRTGEDVAKALAFGAKFVFAARPFLYGMAATGKAEPAIAVLADEFDRALGQLGCTSPAELSRDHIWPSPGETRSNLGPSASGSVAAGTTAARGSTISAARTG